MHVAGAGYSLGLLAQAVYTFYIIVFWATQALCCDILAKNPIPLTVIVPPKKAPVVTGYYDVKTHPQYSHISKLCANRDALCRNNYEYHMSNVCAMRLLANKSEWRDYNNSCSLFMENMCINPGKEFYIAWASNCSSKKIRRSDDSNVNSNTTETNSDTSIGKSDNKNENNTVNETIIHNDTNTNGTERNDTVDNGNNGTETNTNLTSVDDEKALRSNRAIVLEKNEDGDYLTADGEHVCPKSCPEIYDPVCVNVNKGNGKYFKMFTFVNHCQADAYYCNHVKEFERPPPDPEEASDSDEGPSVKYSHLGWSYCGSSRYLAFTRFSEAASAMGHYGWLAGDYRYSHIVEPHERRPGYG